MSNISRVGGKIEESKLEPETKVENIDEIKSNYMKKITPLILNYQTSHQSIPANTLNLYQQTKTSRQHPKTLEEIDKLVKVTPIHPSKSSQLNDLVQPKRSTFSTHALI